MLFKKLFFWLLFMFVFMLIIFYSYYSFFSISLKLFLMNFELFNNYNLTLFLDKNSIIFLFMVSLVTCLVSIYSEIYMEHYNNKKFFFLMFLFFIFMSVLSLSGSYIILFLGWDGLGLSSICLIMFYPNKNTLYNSILTMFFNRLGDVILIFVMAKFLFSYSSFFFINDTLSLASLALLMLCSFTKSAQFPMSSWLPAAMSAPTPISAMVHSSTLVTAGILITQFFLGYYVLFMMVQFLMFFSLTTFLVGGFFGVFELDFKKIIAFSTMSQVSMIIFFCSILYLEIAMAHMIFHAFFKTFLFMSSGLLFVFYFSKQLKTLLSLDNSSSVFISFMFLISIYSMSGLTLSSSFFSKDLLIESLCVKEEMFLILLTVVGSIFTIFYSSKLLKVISSFKNLNKSKTNKSFFFLFMFIFMLFVGYSGQMLKNFVYIETFPVISSVNLILINLILFSCVLFLLKISTFSFYGSLVYAMIFEIYFMKNFFFKTISKPMTLEVFKTHTLSDHFMFKSYYLTPFFINLVNSKFLSNIYGFILVGIFMMI